MINITMNGNPVHAREGASVLEASREDKYASKQFDVNILSLNYLKDVQPQQSAEKRTVTDLREERAKSLYRLDQKSSLRKSYENSAIKEK